MLSNDDCRDRAEAASKSSKSVSSKRRSVKDPPKSDAQLYDATVQRMEMKLMEDTMKMQQLTTFENDRSNKTKPLVSHAAISVVEVSTPSKQGGKRKRDDLCRDDAKVTVACTTGTRGLCPKVQEALYENGLLNHVLEIMMKKKKDGEDPFGPLTAVPSTPPHVTKINSKEEFDGFNGSRKSARARASTGRNEEEIEGEIPGFRSWRQKKL